VNYTEELTTALTNARNLTPGMAVVNGMHSQIGAQLLEFRLPTYGIAKDVDLNYLWHAGIQGVVGLEQNDCTNY
jgi:hypothetical protein